MEEGDLTSECVVLSLGARILAKKWSAGEAGKVLFPLYFLDYSRERYSPETVPEQRLVLASVTVMQPAISLLGERFYYVVESASNHAYILSGKQAVLFCCCILKIGSISLVLSLFIRV